jgi:hypothetical protein
MRTFRPATPYGEAAQGLGDAFVKGLMLAPQRERAEAAAGFDRLRTEQLQGQLGAQQQMSDLFRTMAPGMAPDQVVRSLYSIAATAGPEILRLAPDLARGAFAGVPGATPEQFTNLQLGAGQAWNTTAPGTREHEAANTNRAFGTARINNEGQMARQNAMPMPVFDPTSNQPRFTTQGQAATSGFQPVLPLNEAKGVAFQGLPTETQGIAVGPSMDQVQANVATQSMQPGVTLTPEQQAILTPPSRQDPTPRSYRTQSGQVGTFILRGQTPVDVATGRPIAEPFTIVNTQVDDPNKLTPPELRDGRAAEMAGQNFVATLNDLEQIGERSPDALGATGNILRILQTGVGIAENLGLTNATTLMDSDLARANPAVRGALERISNPDLGDVGRLAKLAVYQAASVLAGQSGRDVSDRDVQQLAAVMGDPTSWVNNPMSMRQSLARLRAFTQRQADIRADTYGFPRIQLGTGAAGRSSDPRQGQQTPPPGANPTAAPAQGAPRQRVRFNPQTGEMEPVQ